MASDHNKLWHIQLQKITLKLIIDIILFDCYKFIYIYYIFYPLEKKSIGYLKKKKNSFSIFAKHLLKVIDLAIYYVKVVVA